METDETPVSKNTKKRRDIQAVVAGLFARKGFHSTSMREIARHVKMNPSSLYHYFTSKEDILYGLMSHAMDEALLTMEEICKEKLPPEEKLARVLRFYTRYYAGDRERLILLVNEMNSLSEPLRGRLVAKQRRYVRLIRQILEELDDRNLLKEIDTSVAVFVFFGMVHYTFKWYQRDGPIGLEMLANMITEIFTGGLLKESSRAFFSSGVPPHGIHRPEGRE